MLYYLLTGQDVFLGTTTLQVCMQHLDSEPEPPSRRLGHPIPEGIEALVLQLLAKSPEARPASALAVLEHLEHLPTHDAWTREDAAIWWQGAGHGLRNRVYSASRHHQLSLTVDMSDRRPHSPG